MRKTFADSAGKALGPSRGMWVRIPPGTIPLVASRAMGALSRQSAASEYSTDAFIEDMGKKE